MAVPRILFAFTLVLALHAPVVFSAQPDTVIPIPEDGSGAFGRTLVTSGDMIIIGSPPDYTYIYSYEDDGGSDAAVLEQRLDAAGLESAGGFGTSLALDGDLLAVGAPLADVEDVPEAGAVHVYQRTGAGWTYHARLTAAAPRPMAHFGASVAIDAAHIIVGAPNEDMGPAVPSGAAYVFACIEACSRWQRTGNLVSSGPEDAEQFGAAVAIENDHAAIVQRGDEAVHVFRRDGAAWQPAQVLYPEYVDTPQDSVLGPHVVIEDGVLAFPSRFDGDFSLGFDEGWYTGALIHVFELRSGAWMRTGTIAGFGELPEGPGPHFDFRDGHIAIGESRDMFGHVFRRNADGKWTEILEVFIDEQLDPVGIAVSRNRLLVGLPFAPLGVPDGTPLVRVYAFDPPQQDEENDDGTGNDGTDDEQPGTAGSEDNGETPGEDEPGGTGGDDMPGDETGNVNDADGSPGSGSGGGATAWLLGLLALSSFLGRSRRIGYGS